MLIKRNLNKWLTIIISIFILLILMSLSVVLGYTDVTVRTVIDAFTNYAGTDDHIVIKTIRLPRSIIAAAVGASLAIAGVLMQTLTKNPLASPSILGINAGAGFAVVLAVTYFNVTSIQSYSWVSFLGAALAAIGVYIIGSAGREGLTPMKLTLAGAATAALFASFTQGLLVLNEAALEQVLFWLAGSVAGRKLEMLSAVLPYMGFGMILALIIAPKLNLLAMGDDVAKGLGLRLGFVKILIGLVVIFLAGSAVAVAGPIGFIGIIIPHISRKIIGIDHRWLLPLSGLLGAILLVASDIGARYILMPQEVPVGVMTAAIGAPFFIYIARKGFNQ